MSPYELSIMSSYAKAKMRRSFVKTLHQCSIVPSGICQIGNHRWIRLEPRQGMESEFISCKNEVSSLVNGRVIEDMFSAIDFDSLFCRQIRGIVINRSIAVTSRQWSTAFISNEFEFCVDRYSNYNSRFTPGIYVTGISNKGRSISRVFSLQEMFQA